jgi:hypothetical protein
LPGKCFSDSSNNSICVQNKWDPNFNKTIEKMIANNLSIKDKRISDCVMDKIRYNYPNPQDYIGLSDSDAYTIANGYYINCSKPKPPSPDVPRDGGETFADDCIKRNSLGYGRCKPDVIRHCARKKCVNSPQNMQTCMDDATAWAQNHCTGNPGPGPGPPGPGPSEQGAYSYCAKINGKCGCQNSVTIPNGQYFVSPNCLGGECDCHGDKSLYIYGVH